MNDNDKLQSLYNHLLQSGLRENQIGDFNTFATNMADEDKAKKFYDNATKRGIKLDRDWDTFNQGRTKYFNEQKVAARKSTNHQLDNEESVINKLGEDALSGLRTEWARQDQSDPSYTVRQPYLNENGQWVVPPQAPEQPVLAGINTPFDTEADKRDIPNPDARKALIDKTTDVNALRVASQMNKEAKQNLNAPQSGETPSITAEPFANIWSHIKNLGQAFADKPIEEYMPFISGYGTADEYSVLNNVSKKITDKQPLSLAESTLATAAGLKNQADELSDPDAWYSAGGVVADMVPYIAEMAATRGASVPGELAGGLIKGTSLLSRIGRGTLKLGVESAVRAPFMSMLPAEYYRRRAGDYALNENGVPMVDANSIQSPLEAGYKAYATTFAEVFSEGLGEGGQALLKTAAPGISTAMGKITPKMLRNIGDKNMWLKLTNSFRKAGKWDGPFWEIAEEYANSFIQAGLTGETDQLKQMFTPEGFREVALPMFLTAGAFKAAELPGKLNYRRVTTRNWKDAQDGMNRKIGEDGVNIARTGLDKILAGNIDEGLADMNNIISSNPEAIPYLANYVKAGLEYNMMKKSIENDEMDKVKGKMAQVEQMTSSLHDATNQLDPKINADKIATFRDTETGDIFILDENNTANLRDQNGLTSAWGVNLLTGKKVMLSNEMPLELVDEKRWWDYHEDAYQSIYNEAMNGQQQAEQQVDEEIATDEAKDELAPLGVQEGGNIEFKGDDYSVNRVTPQGVVVTNDKGESFMITPQEYELINKKQREEQAKAQETAVNPNEQGQPTAQNEQSGNSGQLNNVVNPEGTQPPPVPEAPKTTPWTIGKKTYNIQQIDDDIQFIPFEDGKDDTKAILAEVDTDNYDVEPVVVDVPIPNVPAFAKVKTQKVVKGVSIIAKKQDQQEPLQTQTTDQPSTQTAQPEQVQQEAPIQPNVQLTENPDNEQSNEAKKVDIERRRQEEFDNLVDNRLDINWDSVVFDETAEGRKRKISGTSNIIDYAGMKIVIIDINGRNIPFYLSTGHGGKADVASGKWYPFFGIGEDGWLNKLSGNQINNYYGSSVLKGIAESLDRKIGDIRNDGNIPKVGTTGSHIDAINKSLNPTENRQPNTLEIINQNIKDTVEFLEKEFNSKSELSALENNTQSNQDGGQQGTPDSNASENASIAEQEPKPKSSRTRKPSSDVKQENRESETKKERIVSDDAYEKAREILRKKLNNLNALIDPEMMSAGMTIAAYHLENGITKFADFVKTMTDDFGDAVKPYLKSFYKGSRMLPGMEDIAKEMDSDKDVDVFDLNKENKQADPVSEKPINDTETKKSNNSDNSQKDAPKTVREFLDRGNYEAINELTGGILASLNKGDQITVARKTYTVTRRTRPIKKEYERNGKKGEYFESTITLTSNKGEKVTYSTWDNWIYDGNKMRPIIKGTNASNNLSRDIEGDIDTDLINEFNPFHEKSDSFNIAQRLLNERNSQTKEINPTTALDAIEQHSISKKANEAATSHKNDTPEPTDAQKKAGNYKKGHIKLRGLDISIENPRGSQRSGTDKSGKKWSQTIQNDYGYFLGTVGKDKDHLDVFIGPDPVTGKIFIVDQVDPQTGEFDEHKIMFGFPSEQDARDAYLSNYEEGWNGLGAISEMDEENFKTWVFNQKATVKPRSYDKKDTNWKPKKEAETQEDRYDEVPTSENSKPDSQKERLAKINAIDFNAGITADENHQSMVSSGEINEMEGSELSYAGFIARFSTNVAEVVKTMLTTPKIVPSELRDPKEEAIFDSIATISPNSLKSFDDKFKQNIPSVWFISGIIKKDGEGLDQVAQKASSLFNESENAITEQDVYDFLMNYKGLNGYVTQPNVDYINLKSRFEELTGVSLSKKVIDRYNDFINNNEKINSIDPDLMAVDINEAWYNEMKTAYDNQQLPGEDFFTYEDENELPLQEKQSNERTRNIPGESLERETTGRDDSPSRQETIERGSSAGVDKLPIGETQEKELTDQQKKEIDQIHRSYDARIKESGDKLTAIKDRLRKKKAELAQQRNPQSNLFGNESTQDSQQALFDTSKDFSQSNIKRALNDLEGELSKATREHKALIDERGARVKSIIDNYLNQQDLFNPENNTENVHNRSGISQPDGSSVDTKAQGNVDVVLSNGTTVITDGNELSQSTGGENRFSGSTGGSGLFTPTVGKRDDNQVYQQNEKSKSSSNDAGDFDGRGNEPVGTDGYDVSNEGSVENDNEDSGGVSVSFQQRLDDAIQKQREVENTPVVLMDEANIRETLPVLLSEQQDDVIKAENRFFSKSHQTRERAFGKGMLFTNGTGTGKTYTGLGIIKRFSKQGKNNVLIVVPSEAKINDWIKDGQNLGLSISSIENQQDQGKGIRVTTYAMFVGSSALGKEDFDLVVFDECHRIMDNKNGADSGTTGAFRQAANVSESYALYRLTGVHPVWIESHELSQRLAQISNASYQDAIQDNASIKEEIDNINQRLSELEAQKAEILPSLKERAKTAYEKTKVVLLSATPFKSVFNLRYANGVLFDWGDETTYQQASRTMSRVNPEARFFLDNFGSMFEWKYHQLQTKPKANAEAIAMQEVDFANRMMSDGITSGRAIESNKDYSREFPVVALGGADKMNEAFAAIFDYNENARYSMLIEAAKKVFFSYERSTQLMESLRAGMMLDRIQKHLDLGRKIVIFHRRRLSNVSAPFESILLETTLNAQAILNDQDSDRVALEKAGKALEQVDLFREQFPELLDYEQTLSYSSAIDQITERFGDKVLTLNGETKQRDKSKNIADFNNDDSGKDIIIIQEEAGKEGISLHDKSGNHQRVLINLSIPVSSTTALQIEGRIYRIGQETNAIFEYPLLGLDMEVMAFGANVNKKLSTTENLAVGDQSRDLLRSFAEGVLFNSSKEDPSETQGTGGKEADKRAAKSLSLFQKAVLVYHTNQKKRGRRDQREGVDYYATPEPVGQKMVEWADMADNETTLEPSAGHGAISMWFPEGSSATVIEPSFPLFSKLGVRTSSGNKKLINGTFEQLDPVNKFMSVVMNPPFGQAGSMAISHVQKAFNHLYINGRMVALIPVGAMDKKLDQFFEDNQDARLVGEIKLPSVTFDQAGTSVNTRVVIIDKVSEKSKTQIKQELLNQQLLTSRGSVLMSKEELNDKVNELFKQQSQDFGGVKYVDLTHIKTIQELFDKLEGIDMPKRSSSNLATPSNVSTQSKETPVPQETQSYKVETVKHTKTGETMHVVRLTNSVPYERYQELASIAKKNNGYYNKFIKGFHFNGENPAQDIKNFTDTAFKNEQPLRFSLKSSPKTIDVSNKIEQSTSPVDISGDDKFEEFVSGVEKGIAPEVQARLDEITKLRGYKSRSQSMNDYLGELSEKENLTEAEKSLWDKFVEWFGKILGITKDAFSDVASTIKSIYQRKSIDKKIQQANDNIYTNVSESLNAIFEAYGINIRLSSLNYPLRLSFVAQPTQDRRMDKEAYKKAFKKGGESIYETLYEKQNPAITVYGDKFLSFLQSIIGDKTNAARIVEDNHAYLMLKYLELNPDKTAKRNNTKSVAPEELLGKIGYNLQEHTMDNGQALGIKAMYRDSFVDTGITDTKRKVGSAYHSKSVICYFGDPASRLKAQYVFTIEHERAKQTPTANELVNDPNLMTPEWEQYLTNKGRKNEDGSFDLKGLKADFKDPFSLSFLMIRIGKDKAHGVEIISRYNHNTFNDIGELETVHGQPNATLGSKLDNITQGLKKALFEAKNIKTDASSAIDLEGNVRMANDGKLYYTPNEINGYWVGDNFYIDRSNNVIIMDPSSERLISDTYILNSGRLFNFMDRTQTPTHNVSFGTNKTSFSIGGKQESITKEVKLPDGTTKNVEKKVWVDDVKITIETNAENEKTITVDNDTDDEHAKMIISYIISNGNISNVVLNDMTHIDDHFGRLYDVKKFSAPNAITVGDYFNNLVGLESINLPKVEEVGKNFLVNAELNEVSLPSLKKAGDNFMTSSEVRSIHFPNLQVVGNQFMESSSFIEEVSLPELTTAGDYLFANMKHLDTVYLPKLESVKNGFLINSRSIKEVDLPSLTIARDNFLSDTKITSIKTPKLQYLGDNPFYGHFEKIEYFDLSSLEVTGSNFDIKTAYDKLELPNLRKAGDNFLRYVGNYGSNITSIICPKLQEVGQNSLAQCRNIKEINLPMLEKAGPSFLREADNLEYLSLENLKSVGDQFLGKAPVLKVARIPKLERIGTAFLYNAPEFKLLIAPNLKEIINQVYKWDKGVIVSKIGYEQLASGSKEILGAVRSIFDGKVFETEESALKALGDKAPKFSITSSGIKFSSTDQTTNKTTLNAPVSKMEKGEVEQYIKSFEAKFPNVLPTIVVSDMNELISVMKENGESEDVINSLNEKLSKDKAALVKALITPQGKVYIVASAMSDGMDVLATYMHEQGLHHGIRMFFGNDRQLNTFLNNLYNLVGEERLRQEFGDDFELNAERDQAGNITNQSSMAEEYLARLAEKEAKGELSEPEKTIWQWIMDRLKQLFKRLLGKSGSFNTAINDVIQGKKLSESEIEQLVYNTVRASISQILNKKEVAANEDLRFSIVTSSNKVDDLFTDETIGEEFAQGNKGFAFTARELLQDRMLTVKKLVEEVKKRGGNIPSWANPYTEENLSGSKSLWEMKNYNQKYYRPMLEQIAEIMKLKDANGELITESDISTYLKAKHSIERHDKGIDALSEDPNSDWSREKLTAIVEGFEDIVPKKQLDDLWEAINKATKFSLDKLLNTGLISRETYDEVYNRYENYVPLRSWQHDEATDPENIFEYLDNKPAVSNKQRAVQKAKGRTSEAEDPLGFIQSMAHTAIADGNSNMVKRAALDMVRLNKDMKDLFSVKNVWYVKDANGQWTESDVIPSQDDIDNSNAARKEYARLSKLHKQAIQAQDLTLADDLAAQMQDQDKLITVDRRVHKAHYKRTPISRAKQHEVEVIEHGKKYILIMDPKTANAINGINAYNQELQNALSQTIGVVNRWLTQNFTAKNPAFIPVNWIRDMGYASVSHIINNEGNIGGFYRNIPNSSGAIHREQSGKQSTLSDKDIENVMKTVDLSTEAGRKSLMAMGKSRKEYYDNLYQIFGRMGGLTGYVHLEDPRKLRKDAIRELNRMNGKNGFMDKAWQSGVIQKPGHLLDYMANMSENMSRFATFIASLESGKDLSDAASDAKNITVNFNRKGRATGLLAPLYGFFNATVQGGHNLAHLAKHNKGKFMMAASMFMTAGFLSSMIVAAMGGDDDKKIPDYVLLNNMVIPVGDGKFLTIPLPPGFRSLWAAGVLANQVSLGRKDVGDGMFKAMTSLMDAFSPFTMAENEYKRGEVPFRSIVPTSLVPFYDIAKNEDFSGRKIFRTPFTTELEKYTPDSELGINPNPMLENLAKNLNSIFGGNEVRTAKYIFKNGEYRKAEGANAFVRDVADFNPSVLEHMITYYLGGRGKFFNDIYKATSAVIDPDKELKAYNIPVVKRLVTEPYEYDTYSKFMDVRDFVQANNYFAKKAEGSGKFEEWTQSLSNPKLQEMIITFDVYNDLINTVNELMDLSSDNKEATKKLKATRDSYIEQINNTYDKLYEH